MRKQGVGGGQGRATSPPPIQWQLQQPLPYWGRYAKIGQGAWMCTIRDAGAPYWVRTRVKVLLRAAGGCKPTWVYGWFCHWFCMVWETGARFSGRQSSVHVDCGDCEHSKHCGLTELGVVSWVFIPESSSVHRWTVEI